MTELIAFRAIQGLGRRRADGQRTGDDRRRRPAARPRPLPGHLRRGLRRLQRRRPADRRLLHRPISRWRWIFYINIPLGIAAFVVLARRRCPSVAERVRHTIDYLGHGAAGRRAERDRAADHARAATPTPGARRRSSGSGVIGVVAARRLRPRRAARRRAGAAAGAVPQQRLHDDQRVGLDHRLRAVRLAHLPAALPAGRERCQPDRIRACSCCP